MDPLGSLLLPGQRCFSGVALHRLASSIALDKSNGLPRSDIDRGQECERHGRTLLTAERGLPIPSDKKWPSRPDDVTYREVMAGRVNARGWVVLESIGDDDGGLCVDFFEHPDGGFGFEHFRADPEDRGRWTPVGGFSTVRYDTALEAVDVAVASVSWLRLQPHARTSLRRWRELANPS